MSTFAPRYVFLHSYVRFTLYTFPVWPNFVSEISLMLGILYRPVGSVHFLLSFFIEVLVFVYGLLTTSRAIRARVLVYTSAELEPIRDALSVLGPWAGVQAVLLPAVPGNHHRVHLPRAVPQRRRAHVR